MNAPMTGTTLHAPALERSRLAHRLRRLLRGEVLFDAASRARYATDASIYQIDPVGVVVPRDAADVQAVFELANQMKVPILARGAGTSQCGQTVGEALVIDNSRYLRAITDLDVQRRTVIVEPGVVLDDLNAYLKPHGLWFPVDVSTSAQATIGGMAGNNSCGSRSIAYGNMVHNVLGIDALLADGTRQGFGPFGARSTLALGSGRARTLVSALFELADRERDEIARRFPKVLRRVGGYNLDVFNPQSPRPYTPDGSVNLAHLLVGSEGTLAYFERLHLQLAPLPAHKALGVVNFARFRDAMAAAQHIVTLGPCAVELVDRTMIDLARRNPAFRAVIETALVDPTAETPEAILLVEFAGDDAGTQQALLTRLTGLMADHGHPDSVVAIAQPARQKALWDVRKAGLNIMMSLRGDGKPVSFIEDCAVPLEHLADYTDALTEVFTRHGTRGTWYAHASVGTLHVRPILDMRRDGAARMRAIAEEASQLVRRYQGAFSGEHGDGLVRTEWVGWQFGQRMVGAFETVKDLFDPQGLLNPGKIVRGSRMDDTRLFRYPPGQTPTALAPAFDWSAWNVQNDPVTEALTPAGSGGDPTGGLAKAVEMCNNNGHCRKFDAGVMCPSWRISREEQHLVRGRANTLRQALSGRLPGGLTSDAVTEALSLCVGCKACQRECPTGVDMARMKFEIAAQRARLRRPGLRERLIAYLPRYVNRLAPLAPLLRLRDRLPGLPWLGEALFGIAAARSLPAWRSDTFLRRQAGVGQGASAGHLVSIDQADAVLWVDTFNNAFDPDTVEAALRVFAAAGIRVALAQPVAGEAQAHPLCCGRPFLAAGLVDEARAEARRVFAALAPALDRGLPIIGLEPSCILTARDEYPVLGLGGEAQRLASLAMTFEEFLAREHAANRLTLSLKPLPTGRVWLHGHCHQKAHDAVRPIQTVLGLIPELEVMLIETSCCGMAGAFGYEAEHYEASMQMAQLALLPAVQSAPDQDLIVADGTSCRHQILDGAQRQALHVAQVLARALG